MIIENAVYSRDPISNNAMGIICDIDGVTKGVPINLENSDYIVIKKRIDAGTLTVSEMGD